MDNLRNIIETAFDNRQELDLTQPSAELRDAIASSIALLEHLFQCPFRHRPGGRGNAVYDLFQNRR